MSEIVGLSEARTHLSQLVDRAADGEELVIAENGTPLARLVSLARSGEPRKPAGALGLTFISPDFDDPLREYLVAFQNDGG
jgi:prevent-host-death family protein